ncbi:POTRA domain-containing protein (plasmid) [Edwardsiella tarda]|uniref:ShlB/FhaC/HecB family hemolysin secretion/activation protein n=1 Tax=Edwardsiella tarda TaxID=636 RepID=UPI0024453667|nr:POTRA domain-containing protein [Edwardsiella tarda]WGE31055.1 POTRA domain-containing protein [Edwardsiella tarda]
MFARPVRATLSPRLRRTTLALLLGGLIGSAPAVLAAPVGGVAALPALPPGAGTLDNQLRQGQLKPLPHLRAPDLVLPANAQGEALAPLNQGARVVVTRINLTGLSGQAAQVVKSAAITQLLQPALNKPYTFGGLQRLAQRVTDYLHDQGVLLGRAILPPQTIHKGVVTLHIIPGTFDQPRVVNVSRLRAPLLQRVVADTTPTGAVVTQAQLERLALLLNDIPGVQGQVALSTGHQPGTALLNVTTQAGRRQGGYVGMDNQGSPTTGRGRLMAGYYANELLRTGDQLRIDLLDTYEKSDLMNGQLDYSSLINGYGTRLGATYSHLNYHYTFQQQAFNGYADNWGLYLSHPWIRRARAQVDVRVDSGQQLLTDRYPATFSPGGAVGKKRIDLTTLGVTGTVASVPGGLTGFALSGTVGNVAYRNMTARFWNGADIRGTAGQFTRMNYQLQHTQHLWGPLSLYGRINGQFADRNLDVSQKFLLGGPAGVRAYGVGDGAVDVGDVATAEVRSEWALPAYRYLGHAPTLTVAAFYDQGWGSQSRNNVSATAGGLPLTTQNHLTLAGAGLYATVADANNYALTVTYAQRTTGRDPVSGSQAGNQVWLSALKTF